MKKWFRREKKEEVFNYEEELKEELKNNSIVLSFAISIIIIGFISIFYKNNHTLLIGIAISSLLLTIIQCFSNGNTILNIFPIFTLLIFGFFEKSIKNIPVINVLLQEQYADFIIFLAFSLTFLTQAYKNILFKHSLKEESVNYNDEKNKMIYSELQVIKNIKEKSLKIKKILADEKVSNATINEAIEDLLKYIEDEGFISNVKATLITRGSENKKVTFNIEEVEESIMLNSSLIRNREINANENMEEDFSL